MVKSERINNIRGIFGVSSIENKLIENKLGQFDHVHRRIENAHIRERNKISR